YQSRTSARSIVGCYRWLAISSRSLNMRILSLFTWLSHASSTQSHLILLTLGSRAFRIDVAISVGVRMQELTKHSRRTKAQCHAFCLRKRPAIILWLLSGGVRS